MALTEGHVAENDVKAKAGLWTEGQSEEGSLAREGNRKECR